MYRTTLQDSCHHMKSKYKRYKAILRNCLKVAEQNYYCQLFDDTKQSAYNLEVNKILFEYQYGFRKLYSTTLALIEFTDSIIKFLDEGQYCMSIFVDLTKAFDTVDHEILLDKLDRYGIRGHANDFFRSYLSDRQQYTVINGVNSALKI